MVNIDGSGLTQLTDIATSASYPNWSPDGARIAFNDNSEKRFDGHLDRPDREGIDDPDWGPNQ